MIHADGDWPARADQPPNDSRWRSRRDSEKRGRKNPGGQRAGDHERGNIPRVRPGHAASVPRQGSGGVRQDGGVKPKAVHHVSINVRDVPVAEVFYTERLGMTRRTDRPDFGFAGAWLDAGGQQVHLIEGEPPPAVGQHFAIQVDDLDAAIAELRAAGVNVSDPSPVAANRQAFLNDPSGNGIELHEVGTVR